MKYIVLIGFIFFVFFFGFYMGAQGTLGAIAENPVLLQQLTEK